MPNIFPSVSKATAMKPFWPVDIFFAVSSDASASRVKRCDGSASSGPIGSARLCTDRYCNRVGEADLSVGTANTNPKVVHSDIRLENLSHAIRVAGPGEGSLQELR